jgi:carbon-monoxide dehydrogenase small subunit
MTPSTVREVSIVLNGERSSFVCEARESLSDALRGRLGVRGVRLGCEQGVCGACTVTFNGATARACLILGQQADEARIETVESLAEDDQLSTLQRAFTACHALQCGFCTSGFLAVAAELLRHNPRPTRDEIRHAVSGNLCRGTGYEDIVDAIELAASIEQSQETTPRE